MPVATQIQDTEGWRLICAKKQAQLNAAIPIQFRLPAMTCAMSGDADVRDIAQISGVMTAIQLAITEVKDASELAARIASGEISSADVTTAYCARAAIAHQLTGCLSEILFDRSIERAKELDSFLARTGRVMGPLHGLPISLKDQFCIVDVDSAIGFAGLAFNPSKHDSALVEILESLGAIIHCKTSVPMALMSTETNSNIGGRTLNPFNLSLTSGGSSGGEGALVSMNGSILGVGTDYGGSIRLPASNCGLYGLRPTTRRMPYEGLANIMKGAEGILSVVGPIARSLASVEFFMKAVIDSEPWILDPQVIERAWAPPRMSKRLRIGVISENGQVCTLPPVLRAVETVAARLRKAGHEVFEFRPASFQAAAELFPLFSAANGGAEISSLLRGSGEPLVNEVFDFTTGPALSVPAYSALVQRRDTCRAQFQLEWRKTDKGSGPIDLIMCPCAPNPPALHRGSPTPAEMLSFTTACSVRPDDIITADREPLCAVDAEMQAEYDPKWHRNAPLGLQFVCPRRYQEDALVMMGHVVENAIAV